MPYSLKGRNVLVTGGSRGLGALICERFAAEGCNVAVNYVASEDKAKEVAANVEKCKVKAVVIQGDAGVAEDNARIVKTAVEALGGLDIIIANAAWTKFEEKFGDLDNGLTDEEWDKCWHTNVTAHVQLMRAAAPILKANPDGGVYLMTLSIAGIVTGGSSLPYSVTKAAGVHLMKCLASTQGPKIRVNAILPGLLLTEWGLKYSQARIDAMKDAAALKQETMLDDCVEAYVSAAINKSMTAQSIVIDSGLAIK